MISISAIIKILSLYDSHESDELTKSFMFKGDEQIIKKLQFNLKNLRDP